MRFLRFRQWPILPKILTISVISISFITVVILLYFVPVIEQKMMDGKKEGVRSVVDVAFGIFVEYDALVRNGQMSLREAQERAAQRVRNLRYNEREYFWINDVNLKMVMHPIKPELDGQDLAEKRDPNGKYLFREFVNVSRSKGAGFVDYMWPKPGENAPVPKLSYVKLFEPWGWVIGSGIYVDDVKRDMARLRSYMLGGTFVFTLVTIIFATLIGTGITRPLKKIINGLQDIASGKGDAALTKRIAITSIDEIGLLSAEFNSLMESISSITAFKNVIEEDDSLDDVYARLGEVFTGQLGFGDCRIYELLGYQDKMRQVFPISDDLQDAFCKPEIFDNCELCKAKRTGHVISSLLYPGVCRQFQESSGKNHYCIPLVVGGGTVGIVQFLFEPSLSVKENDSRIFKAEQYIKESLPVIETKRLMNTLRESALRDPLTGLHNRRYLQEYTEKIVAGAARRGKLVGLIMCDLDYFKQVNDTHGHNAGDAVLKETASVIKRSVRESDIVIRFGGEEFLVVLVDISPENAFNVAEKIRENIQNTKFKIPDGMISKTISLGVSEFPADTSSLWSCIKFADVALYRAKDGGRNKSVRFSQEMWSEEQF